MQNKQSLQHTMSGSEGMSSAGKSADSTVQLDSYKKKYELLMNSCEDIEQVCYWILWIIFVICALFKKKIYLLDFQDNHRIAYRIFKMDQLYKEAHRDKK
jgi:hypothetical protein